MHPIVKGSLTAAGAAVALVCVSATIVWLKSEAVIIDRYPLPSTTAVASTEAKYIRRGAHLVAIAGCADCHGENLEGRAVVRDGILAVSSTNLRRAAHALSDDDFERAIRAGIAPDSTSMWIMPSMDYAYMSEDDVAAIVSYLRTFPADGAAAPGAQFDMQVRYGIANGDIEPIAVRVPDASASLDLGPRYDGGRYLARLACADCHGTDLAGSRTAPDLTVVGLYSRAEFFALLHAGRTHDGRQSPAMSRPRFRALYDYETDALYDYLYARANALKRTEVAAGESRQ